MSWPWSRWVEECDDYRDPAFQSSIARAAKGGVVVCGTSRSGKTTLLNRLKEENALGPGVPILDLSRFDSAHAAVCQVEQTACGVLLDEGQIVIEWPSEALQRLRAALAGRPFVMATWPSLFQSEPPRELSWLFNDTASEALKPLSKSDTARMIRRAKSNAPRDYPESMVEAIYRATAGFPSLVARLCSFLTGDGAEDLRAPEEADLVDFIDAASAFNDPFRATLSSLPRRMQRILEEHRSGTPTRLDPLRDHGLALGSPAGFSASLFSLAWAPTAAAAAQPTASMPALHSPRQEPRPALTWIHLSDLHFGAGAASHRFNQTAVIEAIRRDMPKRPWKPDFVFVTGDIAFSAKPHEYRDAARWLTDVTAAAGVTPDALRMVPGNHDVDRAIARAPSITSAHDAIRKDPARLDDFLHSEEDRRLLARRLTAYEDFVRSLSPKHPATSGSVLDWAHAVESPDGRHGRLWIAGLCTVWVSDHDDSERRMVIGERQLNALHEVSEEDLLLMLTHHPPGWLHPRAEELLLDRMAERAPHIHLCGHTHSASARVLRGLGVPRESVRFVAGAAHGDSTERHGYSWGAVRWSRSRERWELGWAPRVFEPGRGIRPNGNRYELADDEFAWEPLQIGWNKPRDA